jgi:hypothetical protein
MQKELMRRLYNYAEDKELEKQELAKMFDTNANRLSALRYSRSKLGNKFIGWIKCFLEAEEMKADVRAYINDGELDKALERLER